MKRITLVVRHNKSCYLVHSNASMTLLYDAACSLVILLALRRIHDEGLHHTNRAPKFCVTTAIIANVNNLLAATPMRFFKCIRLLGTNTVGVDSVKGSISIGQGPAIHAKLHRWDTLRDDGAFRAEVTRVRDSVAICITAVEARWASCDHSEGVCT
jgi:hypothetical protein